MPGSACWRMPSLCDTVSTGADQPEPGPVLAAAPAVPARPLASAGPDLEGSLPLYAPHPQAGGAGPASLPTEQNEFQQHALRVQRRHRGENDFKPCEFCLHWAPEVWGWWKPRMLLKSVLRKP